MLGFHAVQDNGKVAAPLAGRALAGNGHGPGHAEHGEGDVGDGQVAPGLAAVLRPGQQVAHQVAESLPPARTDGQERADGAVAGAVGQRVFGETHQAVPGIGVGQRGLGDGLPAAAPVPEQLIDELFLGEVAVQRGIADPGAPGDLDQADTEPLVGESLRGGGEDPVPVFPGIAALSAHRLGWRDNHKANCSRSGQLVLWDRWIVSGLLLPCTRQGPAALAGTFPPRLTLDPGGNRIALTSW